MVITFLMKQQLLISCRSKKITELNIDFSLSTFLFIARLRFNNKLELAAGLNPKHTIYALSICIVEVVMRKGRK